MAWSEALTTGRSWDQERDTPRIRRAFVTLASGTRWPTPNDFFAALPPSEKLRALPAKASDPDVSMKHIAEIQGLIKGMRA